MFVRPPPAAVYGIIPDMENEMFERNLPPYLANDLAAWEKGVAEGSRFLDCLWGELCGSINIAEINDSAPLLTDLQRRFYKTYLAARHEVLFG